MSDARMSDEKFERLVGWLTTFTAQDDVGRAESTSRSILTRCVLDEARRAREREEALEAALRGFMEKGMGLGGSHPHLAAYVAFPDEVWEKARAALEKRP